MKERLVEVIKESLNKHIGKSCLLAENIADDLIKNGVSISSCNIGDVVFGIYVHYEWINKKGNKKNSEFLVPSLSYLKDIKDKNCLIVKAKKYVASDEYNIGRFLFLDEKTAKEKVSEFLNQSGCNK